MYGYERLKFCLLTNSDSHLDWAIWGGSFQGNKLLSEWGLFSQRLYLAQLCHRNLSILFVLWYQAKVLLPLRQGH